MDWLDKVDVSASKGLAAGLARLSSPAGIGIGALRVIAALPCSRRERDCVTHADDDVCASCIADYWYDEILESNCADGQDLARRALEDCVDAGCSGKGGQHCPCASCLAYDALALGEAAVREVAE